MKFIKYDFSLKKVHSINKRNGGSRLLLKALRQKHTNFLQPTYSASVKLSCCECTSNFVSLRNKQLYDLAKVEGGNKIRRIYINLVAHPLFNPVINEL